jgi:hypothetical protein
MYNEVNKYILLLIFYALVATSCNKDSLDNINLTTKEKSKEAILNFSITFSKVLANKDVQKFVIENSSLKQNGEYEFIYALAKDQEISKGTTFVKVLDNADSERDLKYYDIDIIQDNPLLSIFVFIPTNVKFSSEIKLSDKIYANIIDDDLDKETKIPYFINGNLEKQSINIIPDLPSIVVKENERVMATKNGNIKTTKLPTVEIGSVNQYVFDKVVSKKAIPYKEYIKNSVKSKGTESRSVQRDLYPNQWDGVQRVLFHHSLETWFTGGPELRISAQTVNNLAITQPWDLAASEEHDWVLIDAQFVIWSQEPGLPSRMKYAFTEADGTCDCGKFELGLSASIKTSSKDSIKLSPKYTFGDTKDDLYGECLEYYSEWVDPNTWGNDHQVGSNFICWMNIIN